MKTTTIKETNPATTADTTRPESSASVEDQMKTFRAEHERQDRVLASLGTDYAFPVFSPKFAIEAQRRTAYRDTASAAQEIVDNAIEAGASRVHVIFRQAESRAQKGKKLKSVASVAFIDDGAGMSPEMIRFALTWGGGTHFDDPAFIGKFGFGLPNSSINQSRLTYVYSRRGAGTAWTKGTLNLDATTKEGITSVPEPTEEPLPTWVEEYLQRNGIALESGTVVVWEKPDRLSQRKASTLSDRLKRRFGVTYRYLLDGSRHLDIIIEGRKVHPLDPLFLMPHARFYLPQDAGGAELKIDRAIPVHTYLDESTGERALEVIENESGLPAPGASDVAVGTIRVRTAFLPPGLAVGTKQPWLTPVDEHAETRLDVRVDGNRGISFVRAGREIETVEALPRSKKDQADGLGRWPLLQSYAYHYGMEVSFDPVLDEVFGITNDKQSVRPEACFWRLMAELEFDDHLRKLDLEQRKARKDKRAAWEKAQSQPNDPDEPTQIERAAAEADKTLATTREVSDHRRDDVEKVIEGRKRQRAEKIAKEEGRTVTQADIERAAEALHQEAKRRPYVVETEYVPHAPFFRPEHRNHDQIVVWVNEAHPFYQVGYLPTLMEGGSKAKVALEALLIALGRAELCHSTKEQQAWYTAHRERVWSPHLELTLKYFDSRRIEDEAAEEALDVDEVSVDA